MEKYIPNLNKVSHMLPMLRREVDWDNLEAHMEPPTEKEYLERLDLFEQEVEARLLSILKPLGIRVTIKTDRKSLPYKDEITRQRKITSLVNDAYETEEFFREVVLTLLSEGWNKVRFYIDCEHLSLHGIAGGLGFQFSFRYY